LLASFNNEAKLALSTYQQLVILADSSYRILTQLSGDAAELVVAPRPQATNPAPEA
jgi:hypothetical protein